jgi:hypothetical protein
MMALTALVITFCFGQWQTIHFCCYITYKMPEKQSILWYSRREIVCLLVSKKDVRVCMSNLCLSLDNFLFSFPV